MYNCQSPRRDVVGGSTERGSDYDYGNAFTGEGGHFQYPAFDGYDGGSDDGGYDGVGDGDANDEEEYPRNVSEYSF